MNSETPTALPELPADTVEPSEAQQEARSISIGTEALERFQSWGLSEAHVATLQEQIGEYDYGSCDKKVERIANAGGLVDKANNQVVLPDFIEWSGPRKEGQCNELANKLYTSHHTTGIVDELNQSRAAQGKSPLAVYLVAGNSDVYFSDPERSVHHWVGIGEPDAPIEESVILDASFGKVASQTESGYIASEWTQPTHMQGPLALTLELDRTKRSWNGKPRLNSTRGSILGTSKSGQSVIGFDCIINRQTEQVQPVLTVTDAEGRAEACIADTKGRLHWINMGAEIGQADRAETEQLMDRLQKMQFTDVSTEEASTVSQERMLYSIYDEPPILVASPV